MSRTRRVSALVAIAALGVACSGSDSFKLVSMSMCPTFGPGDHVKTAAAKDLNRGDVVIARQPKKLTGQNTPTAVPTVVTRIVAVPGDIIATQDGHLLLNGQPAEEPWLQPGATTPNYFAQPYGPLGADTYVGMGDNRVNMVTYEFSRQQVEGSAGEVRAHSSHCDEATPSTSSSSSTAKCTHRPAQGEAVTRECSDLLVFMRVDAPQDAIDAVAAALHDDTAVETSTYVDKQAAQSEFSSIMSDQPNVVAPADLPTSFHVLLKSGQDRDAVRSRYLSLPGVLEVIIPPP